MHPFRSRRGATAAALLLTILSLGACSAPAAAPTNGPDLPPAVSVLPGPDVLPDWERQDPRTYDAGTLYAFMNGAADLYFTYGFRELATAEWVSPAGDSVQVEVYRTASDADAYGLFTYTSFGDPLDLGVDGEIESGYRIAFWQRSTFVQVMALGQASDEELRALAEAASSTLPPGGERPALAAALPAENLQPGSARFFRSKMALDNFLWIGPDDVLGLGPDVEGIVARYEVSGGSADLLLVAFPDAGRAQEAAAGLTGAGLESLVEVTVSGATMGAVLGDEAGRGVLAEAMEKL